MKKLLLGAALLTLSSQVFAAEKAQMDQGKKVFTATCIACHQATGLGLPGAFPPLAKSDYIKDEAAVIKQIVHGSTGGLTVNGVKYAMPMPAQGATLSDEDIAAVITYVRNSWGNSYPATKAETVKKAR
mgnify:CR=1 FL=1